MSASISYRPLFVHANAPYGGLLKIDDCTILLDCGWDEKFSEDDLDYLKSVINEINFVVLTYPLIEHIGALPYLVGKLGLSVPIYSTLPVKVLGKLAMEDICVSKGWNVDTCVETVTNPDGSLDVTVAGFTAHITSLAIQPTVEQSSPDSVRSNPLKSTSNMMKWSMVDVEKAFDLIEPIEFHSEVRLPGSGDGLVIKPFPAGRTLGGCYWNITKDAETYIYAVAFNLSNEHHIDGGVMESSISRPTLLITDADMALVERQDKRKERENMFLQTIKDTLKRGGNVIVPVDGSSRAIELMMILRELVNGNNHSFNVPIIFAGAVASHLLKSIQQLVQWGSKQVQKDMDLGKKPFDLNHIQTAGTVVRVLELISRHYEQFPSSVINNKRPAIILTADVSLSGGMGSEIVRIFGKDKDSTVLLTYRIRDCTLRDDVHDDNSDDNTLSNPLHENLNNINKLLFQRAHRTFGLHVPHPDTSNLDSPVTTTYTRVERVTLTELEEQAYEAIEQYMAEQKTLQGQLEEEEESDCEDDSDVDDVSDHRLARSGKLKRKRDDPSSSFLSFAPVERKAKRYDLYGERVEGLLPFQQYLLEQERLNKREVEVVDVVQQKRHATHNINNTPIFVESYDSPYTLTITTSEVTILSKVAFVDLNGRVDGSSLKNFVCKIQPKTLIITHGNTLGRQFLGDEVNRNIATTHTTVYIPKPLELIQMSKSTTHKFLLSDALNSSLAWVSEGGYSVARVTANINVDPLTGEAMMVAGGDRPIEEGIYIGRASLVDVKHFLTDDHYIPADLYGGILLCGTDRLIEVYKEHDQIVVEGEVSEEYYRIRDIIYKQFKLV